MFEERLEPRPGKVYSVGIRIPRIVLRTCRRLDGLGFTEGSVMPEGAPGQDTELLSAGEPGRFAPVPDEQDVDQPNRSTSRWEDPKSHVI